MLYFIHHPSGNVIIRTTNPSIVLHHQRTGWVTATSWPDVLEDHPEWLPPEIPRPPQPRSKIANLLSTTLAFLPGYTPFNTAMAAARSAPKPAVRDDRPSNSLPPQWFTAVERGWYVERSMPMPTSAWNTCRGANDVGFEYRLESGVHDLAV